MANSREDEFHSILDRKVKEKIKSIGKKNPTYFSEYLNAQELLKYFNGCITPMQIEKIDRVHDREGNVLAVHKLMDEVIKYSKFSLRLLKSLVETNHEDVAKKIMEGIDLGIFPECQHSGFIQSLNLQQPQILQQPPAYEESQESMLLSVILSDQMQKENIYQNSRSINTIDSSIEPSMLSSPSTVTSVSDNLTMNIPLSIGTRDDNLSSSRSEQNNPSLDYSQNPYPLVNPNGNATRQDMRRLQQGIGDLPLNNDVSQRSQSATIREHTERYASGDNISNAENNDEEKEQSVESHRTGTSSDTTARFDSNFSTLQQSELYDRDAASNTKPKKLLNPYNNLSLLRGDSPLRYSELCISNSDSDTEASTDFSTLPQSESNDSDGDSNTKPKEPFIPMNNILLPHGNSPLSYSELCISNSDSDTEAHTRPKDLYVAKTLTDNISEKMHGTPVEPKNEESQNSSPPLESSNTAVSNSEELSQLHAHSTDSSYHGNSTAFADSNAITIQEVVSTISERPEVENRAMRCDSTHPERNSDGDLSNRNWTIGVAILAGIIIGRVIKY